MTQRIITSIGIDVGYTTIPLPEGTRVFDALEVPAPHPHDVLLVISQPVGLAPPSTQLRHFFVTGDGAEVEGGKYAHIRSLTNRVGVTLHVLEKLA